MEVCHSFKIKGVSKEAMHLKLFPYSLTDRAQTWLNSLPLKLITNWNELEENLLIKYFPPNKNAKYRSDFNNFQQFARKYVSE